ncbi:hypothetical protein PPROV_000749600 [Pycnococcus provasolii]|uniref:Succinate-semialdehyde dehydrogenase, mitochondrial n=2 Tax=Pycnococcus provasolii TaxID=41880 RepID=A0A830HV19_9CHLO|nr:hypothetical protein PPROV_000749600 [Pycnococcus provasolii]|mmetsp:Transcript_4512/g.11710  ORF Transcript_4512/g.11710 Transcript_4512/m.11710 type:complete len:554 (-) Transcript_4512:8-1669(-)
MSTMMVMRVMTPTTMTMTFSRSLPSRFHSIGVNSPSPRSSIRNIAASSSSQGPSKESPSSPSSLSALLNDPCLFRDEGVSFIDGAFSSSSSSKKPVINPANGQTIALADAAAAEETQKAISAAKRAMPEWAAQTAKARGRVLRKWFELIRQNANDLAIIMTAEQGKPLKEARGEIAYANSFLDWYAEEGRRVSGMVLAPTQTTKRQLVVRQPVGVCAAITPWNFPSAMITRKAAPALAAGCSMVIKPSEATPLSALALAELAKRAGVPDGVLSVVVGDASDIGGVMTSHPDVRKLTFTGSTRVGKLLSEQCASTVKNVTMELGGNAPFLVFDDADVDAAVADAMATKFRNAGQVCTATNRMLVQRGVYNEFIEKLAAKTEAMSVTQGLDAGCDMGPLFDLSAPSKAEEHVADALAKGSELLTGGKRDASKGSDAFYLPTVVSCGDRNVELRAFGEETFGPVANVYRFDDEDAAIAMANNTRMGLSAFCHTRDMSRAWRVGEALEYGMVGLNEGALSDEVIPFGGCKESGLGREGGVFGIEAFLETKLMVFGRI